MSRTCFLVAAFELGRQFRGHESAGSHFDVLDCGSIMTAMMTQLHRVGTNL